jgi:hypothetical protein
MTDRPIIFSAPMIRALLEGRKTQTRRVLKNVPQAPDAANVVHAPTHPEPYIDSYCSQRKTEANPRGMSENWCWWTRDDRCGVQFKVRYVPGDRIYVRENWQSCDQCGAPDYAADVNRPRNCRSCDATLGPWTPSIHMPRWASRLTLIVESVKVERLTDISDADAMEEGVTWANGGRDFFVPGVEHPNKDFPVLSRPTAREMYAALWDTINGSGAWLKNPWIVAVQFRVVRANIDAVAP